jgi:hypothetical protein
VSREPRIWVRWLALACALLFCTVSTAEAAHLHKLARQEHHVQAPSAGSPQADTEEHCPLCVAGHPALPAPMPVAPAPTFALCPALPVAPFCGTASSWSFARFSRPPPVIL